MNFVATLQQRLPGGLGTPARHHRAGAWRNRGIEQDEPQPRHCDRGFTLLELILAIAMAGMLVLSLYMAMYVAFRARNSAGTAMGPMRQASYAMDVLRGDLESALPPTGIMAGAFYGELSTESSYIEFYTLGSDAELRRSAQAQDNQAEILDLTRVGGVERVELSVEAIEDGSRALIRRSTSNLLPSGYVEPEEEIVARGVRTFSVQYYDGFAWQEYWDSTAVGDTLPAAVEITLELDRLDSGASADAKPYRVVRVFTLPCHRPADGAAQMGGMGGSGL